MKTQVRTSSETKALKAYAQAVIDYWNRPAAMRPEMHDERQASLQTATLLLEVLKVRNGGYLLSVRDILERMEIVRDSMIERYNTTGSATYTVEFVRSLQMNKDWPFRQPSF